MDFIISMLQVWENTHTHFTQPSFTEQLMDGAGH